MQYSPESSSVSDPRMIARATTRTHVLVVDDEQDIAGLIKHGLEKGGDIEVEIVGTGDGALKAVNERLWVIEDDIRLKEKAQSFDDGFVRLARAVYFENDERAKIKKDINLALGSAYVEEKSYEDYRATPQ